MESTLRVPLKEQENLKELFRILDENGMKEEKKQVMELADYLDGMDEQLGAVLNELKMVKEQLGQMQDRGLRASAAKVIAKVEGKVQAARDQIQTLKARFMNGVDQTLTSFKEKGILALSKTIDVLGIQKGLLKIREQLNKSIAAADRGIESLATIGDEMHEVKTHIGNIHRELAGKGSVHAAPRDMEKGIVFQIQKVLYQAMGAVKGMEQRTGKALQRFEYLAEKAGVYKKTSVRESLRSIRTEQQDKSRETAGREGKPDAGISFFAAECMEFTDYGELRENLTLPEAVKAYRQLAKKGTNSGPGIGFVLQDPAIPDYSDVQWPLFQFRDIAKEEINLIPAYRDHPLVKQAVQEMQSHLPELTQSDQQKKHPEKYPGR